MSSTPPIAAKRPHTHQLHGDLRDDPWFWLKDKDDPDVIAYLDAENAWCEARMAHTADLQENVFQDMKRRIKEDDTSLPWQRGTYGYFRRGIPDKEYKAYYRRKVDAHNPDLTAELRDDDELILDCNALAEGHEYFDLGFASVSPGNGWLAYAVDTSGDEYYRLSFKQLDSGAISPVSIDNIAASLAWATDERTVFYVTMDAAHRPWRVWRYCVGQPPESASLVFEEPDEAFYVSVGRTRSNRFVLISSHSKVTSEVYAVDAAKPASEAKSLRPRVQNVEYHVDHRGDHFYILSNEQATNFKVTRSRVADLGTSAPVWDTVIDSRDDTTLLDIDLFEAHLIVHERRAGLDQILVCALDHDGDIAERHNIAFDEPLYTLYDEVNAEFATVQFRFGYSSLTTPHSIYRYDLNQRARELLKQQPVLGGFASTDYASERLWATARDGERVPISLVYRKTYAPSQPRPLLLYGYGAYGANMDPYFSSNRLTLLDRGCIFAIAHIRGGQEMGRRWYEDGKFTHKKNTFFDFIDCAEHLIAIGYTASDRLAIMGGSAGGLLIGACLNERPELFKAAVAMVPFVDVLTTMLDLSLPLTTLELDEWGDPRDREYYDYIKSYSPVDNVSIMAYPAILITAGLNDPRVSYWEPAKWTAKLREYAIGDAPLLLKTNMGAGHGGASGRYGQLREIAFEYAFVLDQLGLKAIAPIDDVEHT